MLDICFYIILTARVELVPSTLRPRPYFHWVFSNTYFNTYFQFTTTFCYFLLSINEIKAFY